MIEWRKKKKTEFSKKLAVWAACMATAASCASFALAAFDKQTASDVATTVLRLLVPWSPWGKSWSKSMPS
jgi:hypothetical protein